ncbi:L-serine ammonia-lyase, iron-sulfur-dependent, subunit alpha [Erysipelotrichaceae bacterium OttesenSCG-928-M19]|nr:L-serine ammonia-lyase, iron-sulfur-dependent, subunit alpha [Erysipelotrichaceae bacterium OttesenSCG-928-M19]
MQSLKEFYKEGPGPSSSHTMGPQRAAKKFMEEYPEAKKITVTLHGSLSLTGKGHLTDWIILQTIKDIPTEILWEDDELPGHPNGMIFRAFDDEGKMLGEWIVYSVGGGTIVVEGLDGGGSVPHIYELNSLDEIIKYINKKDITLFDYIKEVEGDDIVAFLETIFDSMIRNVERGLNAEGLIPGTLKLERVAKRLNKIAHETTAADERDKLLVSSYAYAVSEENASGGFVVTAPTCGAAGVIPALMYYYYKDRKISKDKMIEALGIAGLYGNLIKQNASISGAEGGCQAEVGTACSMGAAAVSYLEGLDNSQIEYAAEIAIEHHLGLTCDPVQGYVQIPCIERNGQAALRSIDAMLYAKVLAKLRKNSVSFDTVVRTMKETGDDLKQEYRETALGGLATNYYRENKLQK